MRMYTAAFVALVVAAGVSAQGMKMSAPPGLDYSTTRASENGLFTASFSPQADPIPLNRIHSWRLHVQDAGSAPVTDAAIVVGGGMPQHGHGLPTAPRVTQNLGGGDYLVEGLRFQMRGWWVVSFTITSGGKTDTVTFNLDL
jgi:hypothetical protein